MPQFKLACLLTAGFAVGFPFQAVAQQSPPDGIQVAFEQRVRQEPDNPELFFEMATMYWDAAYRGRATLSEAQKRDFTAKGLLNVDRALALKPDYVEALVYKNLLLRLQATIETDADRQQALIREANEIRAKADLLLAERRR